MLNELLTTLLRSPESTPVLIRVNTGNSVTYELTAGELATLMLAETDTRRTNVLGQPAKTKWTVHPANADGPVISMSSEELIHSLPFFQKSETVVDTVELEVISSGTNVRAVPTTANNVPVAVLDKGTRVMVQIDSATWKTIAAGTWKGAVIRGDMLKVPR